VNRTRASFRRERVRSLSFAAPARSTMHNAECANGFRIVGARYQPEVHTCGLPPWESCDCATQSMGGSSDAYYEPAGAW
jgi:hypothetical protein